MNDMFYENIDLYAYGDCTEQEAALFEQHIKSCEKCRAEYELACSVKAAMCSMPRITPPADFSRQINNRLDNELKKKNSRRLLRPGYRRYSAAAACLVLAAVLGADGMKLIDGTRVDETTLPFEASLHTQAPQSDNADESTPESVYPTENPVTEYVLPSETASAYSDVPSSQFKPDTARKASSTPTAPVSAPAASQQPTAVPQPEKTTAPVQQASIAPEVSVEPEQDTAADAAETMIPSYMDPRDHVVLASTVERQYKTTGVNVEDLPVKERNLAAEFALLENPRTGNIIANPATLSSLEGVEIAQIKDNRSGVHEYGIGSGSILISAKDKDAVDEILEKYVFSEDNSYYYFTADNFKYFIDELNQTGITYKEHLIPGEGSNVAFKLVVA
ncbi:MAG: zf-HC2 domain-containing protein [Clostridia bacterium]|nr:zf-HC2 domain-containing protein [Clostridia bacterium]